MIHEGNCFIQKLDRKPLWLLGIVLQLLVFVPYLIMGENSVFVWHDQMDENILHYVLPARHMGEHLSAYPEMMGGLQSSALQPFALLFIPLYRLFSPFVAFVIQYAIVFAIAFYGMYFLVNRFTESGIISLLTAGCFAMLPFYPVYGGAVAGIPICFLGICLLQSKKKLFWGYGCILLYTLTAHLVFTGYVMGIIWAGILVWSFIKKTVSRHSIVGFFLFCALSCLINIQLILEILLKKDGFVSHRTEFVGFALPFREAFRNMLTGVVQHAEACQKYLLIPMALMLLAGIIFRDSKDREYAGKLKRAVWGAVAILGMSLLYAFLNSEIYVNFKNQCNGILRYFQMDRFSWLMPALFWFEMALCIGLWWNRGNRLWVRSVTCVVVVVTLLPSVRLIASRSYFYMSVNQLRNGSEITGNITWRAFYSDDVMEEIEHAIGREMTEYRIVHIGMNPTPALMHGFYTVDGYANSYPLEYKHEFRRVMEKELEKDSVSEIYYDLWGSRCYLFNSQTGTSYMNGKNRNVQYENLEYDWNALKDLGCDYIFSCGEIVDYEKSGLRLVGDYESDTSYWHVWVYELRRVST